MNNSIPLPHGLDFTDNLQFDSWRKECFINSPNNSCQENNGQYEASGVGTRYVKEWLVFMDSPQIPFKSTDIQSNPACIPKPSLNESCWSVKGQDQRNISECALKRSRYLSEFLVSCKIWCDKLVQGKRNTLKCIHSISLYRHICSFVDLQIDIC